MDWAKFWTLASIDLMSTPWYRVTRSYDCSLDCAVETPGSEPVGLQGEASVENARQDWYVDPISV